MRNFCKRRGIGESRRHIGQGAEGADHEAGADQQHQCERHLHDDQRLAGAMAFAALAEGAAAFAQAGVDAARRST